MDKRHDATLGETTEGKTPTARRVSRWAGSRRLLLLLIIPIAILIFEFVPREVAFDGNQATSGEQPSMWHPRFVSVELPDCVYGRDGYRFAGWSEDSGGQVTHLPGEIVSPSESVTYFAAWKPILAVSFIDSDNTEGGGPDDTEADDNGMLTLPEPHKREGYQFAGWSGYGGVYEAGSQVRIEEPAKFVAQWRPMATFVGAGANEGKVEPVAAAEDGSLTLPECAFGRADCAFRGWMDMSSSTLDTDVRHINYPANVLKSAGETVSLAEPKTYCAVWEFGDQVKGQVSVEQIVNGDSNNGLPTGGIMLCVTNNSAHVLDLGCAVRNTDRLYCVAPGQTTLAVNAVFGSEDWSQYNPEVSAYAPLEGRSSIEGEYQLAEKEVERGRLVIEITNSGGKELHFCKARALGRTDDRYVMKENDRFDASLAPGQSTTIGFGTGFGWSDDTEWSQYERSYYLYGYAVDG